MHSGDGVHEEGVVVDEYAEPVDERAGEADELDDREGQSKQPAAWLPWLVLAIAVVIVAVLFWRYAQPPGLGNEDSAPVLTAARVPNVVGMTQSAAVDAIKRSGFVAEEDLAFSSGQAPGMVVSQAPTAGTKLTKGAPVVMVVAVEVGEASGVTESTQGDANRVPNVVGMTKLRADELLTDTGYWASTSQGYSTSRRRGIIYDQTPDAGMRAGLGSTVNAMVSLGPPPPGTVQVPNVIGDSVKQAVDELEHAGLDPRSMVQYHPQFPKVVFQQNPVAGTLAPVGSRVFILSGD